MFFFTVFGFKSNPIAFEVQSLTKVPSFDIRIILFASNIVNMNVYLLYIVFIGVVSTLFITTFLNTKLGSLKNNFALCILALEKIFYKLRFYIEPCFLINSRFQIFFGWICKLKTCLRDFHKEMTRAGTLFF